MTFSRIVSRLALSASALFVVFAGCSRTPVASTSRPSVIQPPARVQPASTWSDRSDFQTETDDLVNPPVPPPQLPELLVDDPLGELDAMLQQIEVHGFGNVESKEVFLKVEGTKRVYKVGELVLGFSVAKIEEPFVTLTKGEQLWKLSTANSHIKKEEMPPHIAIRDTLVPPDTVVEDDVDVEIEEHIEGLTEDALDLPDEMNPIDGDNDPMMGNMDPDGLGLDEGGGAAPSGDPNESPEGNDTEGSGIGVSGPPGGP